MKRTIVSLAALAVIALWAVQANSEITGHWWKLIEVNGVEVPPGNANLRFDGNTKRYSGSSGCNYISGNYKIDDTNLTFSDAIITRRACMDPEVQKIETEFLKVLYATTSFQIHDDVLRLYNKDNQRTLVFRSNKQ